MSLTSDASLLLIRELRALQREILLFPDDTLLWQSLPGITNSAGNLALHVAGNLRHFIGFVIGHIPYVRNREQELGRRTGTREEVVAELDAAIVAVGKLTADTALGEEFPDPPGGHHIRSGLFLMHLCAHTAYHLGQVGYLRRALTGDARTSGALPLQDISIQ